MLMKSQSRSVDSGSAAGYHPRPSFAIAGLAACIAVVFALDSMTALPHVHHLYYFPIIFAAIWFGIAGGIVTSTFVILLYHLANPLTVGWRFEESDLVQIGVFVAVGMVAARLASDARRLHRLAMTDDLTGLHNLRSFELEAQRLRQRARAARSMLCVLVIDVDRLKSINDQHGHLAGADAVRLVGEIFGAQMPADAVACRYGGDEFVIALSCRQLGEAERLADDLRRAVHASAPVLAHLHFDEGTLTISVGLAWRSFENAGASSVDAGEDDLEALFRAADAALYVAKNRGRNRLHVA
jgi:diguanylate cyclase (GGDEF)-like protein